MIDLFILEYPDYIEKREKPNGVKILLDTKTNTSFVTDNSGLIEFKDNYGCIFCFTDGTYTINGRTKAVIRKGQYCIVGNDFFILMTLTREEVLERAFNYFIPLTNSNIEDFTLREGIIFLN